MYGIAAEPNLQKDGENAMSGHGYSRRRNFGVLVFCCELWLNDTSYSTSVRRNELKVSS